MVATRTKSGPMTGQESTDEQLLGRLLAPPELDDGVQSLEYWRRRRQQLPWYRIRARREAMRMIVRWEQRVGAAILSQHRAPLEARVSAGVLVVRTRLARWTRRAGIALLAAMTTVAVFLTVLVAAAVIFLLHGL
ncbi:MAG: hypothetical protein ACTHQQ_14940 [Solirubrobacteraceae bacterium]